jgi:hypothetical protein
VIRASWLHFLALAAAEAPAAPPPTIAILSGIPRAVEARRI